MTTVYVNVSPGARLPDGVWDFVAVTVVPGRSSGGEVSRLAKDSRELGTVVDSARTLDVNEPVPSDELGDTERAEAISIIEQLRNRMIAIE